MAPGSRRTITLLAVATFFMLGGCAPTVPDLGFAVALTIRFDDSVSDAQLGAVQELAMQITGDHPYAKVISLGRAANRVERVPYYPAPGTNSLTIAVTAETLSASAVATGTSGPITMKPGKTSAASVELSASNALPDLGVADEGQDAAPNDDGIVVDGGTHALTLALEGAATYPSSGATPSAVAAVDVSGDGNIDVVTLDVGAGTIDVRLGNADGTLGALVTTNVGAAAVLMTTGDFDHDGHVDVAIGVSTAMSIQVWRGDGSGAFTKGGAIDPGYQAVALAAADFDVDGAADLVIVGATSNKIAFSANAATVATINAHNLATQSAVAIGDINGDTLPDIVILQPASFGVEVILDTQKTGARTFSSVVFDTTSNSSAGYTPRTVATGDLDGDGLADIAVSTNQGTINFCYAHKDGTCTQEQDSNTDNRDQLSLVDVNGDGHADLVMTHGSLIEGVGRALRRSGSDVR